MEETPSYPPRLRVNLKNLPPINPRIHNGNYSSIPPKFEKSRYVRRVPQFTPPNQWPEMKPYGQDGSPVKPVSSDTAQAQNTKKENGGEIASTSSCRHGPTKDGTSEKREAKSRLFEICTANYWKPPLFECCEEEGPNHAKRFRFKVIVEMKGAASVAVLECYGAPQTRKKVAAEHAAEGALWYLNHLGYCSKR